MTDLELETIKHFTKAEIEATGATVKSINVRLFTKMDIFRVLLNRKVRLLHNGLTTGNHKSTGHTNGTACDCYLDPREGKVDFYFVFKCAIDAGFNKVGIYWNGSQYSFHLEIAPKSAFWSATKKKPEESWNFDVLILDPAKASILRPVDSQSASEND